MRSVNVEPRPGSLSTVTSPPIMRANRRVIARPSPVPPYRLLVAESACANASNSLAICACVMPMPESVTRNAMSVGLRSTSSVIAP